MWQILYDFGRKESEEKQHPKDVVILMMLFEYIAF